MFTHLYCLIYQSNCQKNYCNLSILIFNSKLFFICFIAFLFHKTFNNFFSFKIIKRCPQHILFNFFNHKNFFRLIWNIAFCKNHFIFWCSYVITSIKFRTFLIIFLSKVNIHAFLYIRILYFNCSLICIDVFTPYNIWFIDIYIF